MLNIGFMLALPVKRYGAAMTRYLKQTRKIALVDIMTLNVDWWKSIAPPPSGSAVR
jgi:hypothetical protein